MHPDWQTLLKHWQACIVTPCRDQQAAAALGRLMEVAKAQLPQKRRQEILRVHKKEALQAQRRSQKCVVVLVGLVGHRFGLV